MCNSWRLAGFLVLVLAAGLVSPAEVNAAVLKGFVFNTSDVLIKDGSVSIAVLSNGSSIGTGSSQSDGSYSVTWTSVTGPITINYTHNSNTITISCSSTTTGIAGFTTTSPVTPNSIDVIVP